MPLYIAQSGDLDRCYRCLTDWLTTLKDRATQLLIKYKSGALATQLVMPRTKMVEVSVALTMKICWGWEAESLVAAVGGEPERLWWRNWRLTEVTVDRIQRFLLLSSQGKEEDLQGPYMQYKQLCWTGRMIIFFLKCLATFLSSQEEEGDLRTLCKAESVIALDQANCFYFKCKAAIIFLVGDEKSW